jgi:hypothetical protein
MVVQPASAATLSVSGYPSSTVAGTSHSFTVTALDQYGNLATGYTGTVKFMATNDAVAVLPSNYTFLSADGGTKTFSATFKTVAGGSKTLIATDTVSSLIAGSESGIAVTTAAAATISVVSGSGQSAPINNAFGSALIAHVVDAYSNPVSGVSVTFSGPSSGASGSFATCSGGNPQTYSCAISTDASGQASASTFTANGTAGGPYNVAASASGTNTANFALTNQKANQTISFTSTAPSNAKVGGATYTVAATGGASGNAVTFSIDSSASSVCSISGSTVSFTATGTCVIDGNQAGSSNYNAAPQAQQSFTVNKGDQTISFGTLANKRMDQGPITVSATASSGLTVAFTSATTSVCTVSATTVTLLHIGTCTINANQAGNSDWNTAPQVQQSFTISIGNQGISFTSSAPTNATVGGATYMVSATGGGSGNAVSFTIDSTASTICSITGSAVSFTAAGTCVVDANQAGNADWNPAPQAQQSLTVISPVAYAAIGAAQTWTTSSAKNVTYPAGTAANDLVLLVLVNNKSTAGPSAPTGWTLLGDVSRGNVDLSVYSRLSGGETFVSLSPSPGNSGASAWVVRYIRASGYPPNPATAATAVVSSSSGGGSTTLTPTMASATVANATMISIVGEAGTSSLSLSSAHGFTRETTQSSTGISMGIGDQLLALTGIPTAPTWSSAVSGDWGALTIAFH